MALHTGHRVLSTGNRKAHLMYEMLNASVAEAMWHSSHTTTLQMFFVQVKTENPKYMHYKIML
jgi:hypothetical protein